MPTNQWAFMGRVHHVEETAGKNGGVFYKVTIHSEVHGDKGYPATIVCKLGKSVATPPPAEGTPVAVSGMFGHFEGTKDGRYFMDLIATELRPLAVGGATQERQCAQQPLRTQAQRQQRPPAGQSYHVDDSDVPHATTDKNADIPF